MKKSLKAGLWMAALGLLANPQEGLAANQVETNKNVREVLGEKKDNTTNDSVTYQTTAADFGKQTEKKTEKENINSLDVVQTVSLLNDTINALVKSYGKDGANEKINEIKEEYPDFENLSEAKQKEIVMKKFLDKPGWIVEFLWNIALLIIGLRIAVLLSSLSSGSRRR